MLHQRHPHACAHAGTTAGHKLRIQCVAKASRDQLPSPKPKSSTTSSTPSSSTSAKKADVLNLPLQSSSTPPPADHHHEQKITGLPRAPISSGATTATKRFDLPSPSIAVRNLVEHAKFGHLCTMMSGMHHRRAGYPFGTLVDFAADGAGYPIFQLSPLAIHARNIIEDPRCSLVLQMPGWTGLANARVTIFGDIYPVPADLQPKAREIFAQRHANSQRQPYVTGNFLYFRMNTITDIYFVGGFGTVQWIKPEEYVNAQPDMIALNNPNKTLETLNDVFGDELRLLLLYSEPADEASFISIDAHGVDIRVRRNQEFGVERVAFDMHVNTLEEAVASLRRIVHGKLHGH